ncbi:histidine kinase [Actinomadura fulvescens]|uniref:sensor histidine kinase n=1 Tax=Actinomadura fulvescens TaxID=46160 RepID=UPI0031E20249
MAALGEVALVLALLWRRQAPLAVAWAVMAGTAAVAIVEVTAPGTLVRAIVGADPALWVPAAAPFAAYASLAFGRNRVAWVPVVVLTVIATQPWDPDGARITSAVLLVAGPALVGAHTAARRRLLQGRIKEALADERARLAAEMHDVVTHRVSLMVLQAGTMSLCSEDETTRANAEQLRALGCHALEELRDLLGVLRGPEVPDFGGTETQRAPVPRLEPLIVASRSIGTSVELIEEGDPSLAAPVIARTAYRIVEEALTNVHKHAPGARVRAQVRYGAQTVRLTVHNSPPPDGEHATLAATGSGTGLPALRRRVELVGGSLQAGSAPDGGFSVDATLPSHVPTREGPERG